MPLRGERGSIEPLPSGAIPHQCEAQSSQRGEAGIQPQGYVPGDVDKHVLPFIGEEPVGTIDEEMLDSLDAELARCREHCGGNDGTDQTNHVRARLRSSLSPTHMPSPGGLHRPADSLDPERSLSARCPMCHHVDALGPRQPRAAHWREHGQHGRKRWETSTKTHADRRVVLDVETVELRREHVGRSKMRLAALGLELNPDLHLSSLSPDGATERVPDCVTQRFGRLVAKVGIDTTLHGGRSPRARQRRHDGVPGRLNSSKFRRPGNTATRTSSGRGALRNG